MRRLIVISLLAVSSLVAAETAQKEQTATAKPAVVKRSKVTGHKVKINNTRPETEVIAQTETEVKSNGETAVPVSAEQVATDARRESLLAGVSVDYAGTRLPQPQYTERDLQCLAKNIYYEAGSEPRRGKVAVAQVTLNRMRSGKFPETVCGVVYQKTRIDSRFICQFSWTCRFGAGTKAPKNDNWDESVEVARAVLEGDEHVAAAANAMYFHNTSVKPGWGRKRAVVIGQHIFYE